MIEADSVSFAYARHPVLDGVSFQVRQGEMVALAGANGSGKSTLIRVLLGLAPPTGGSVRLFGVPPARLADRHLVGYVPQRPTPPAGFPATVEEIVAAGRLLRGNWWRHPGPAARAEVDHALESVALDGLRRTRISELSGGQLQRAFIAKALVNRPALLVLDEPVAGVDAESQQRFRDSLTHLVKHHGSAVLLVSHELSAVAEVLDRVLVLRRGRLAFEGAPAALAATGVSLGVHREDLPVWLEGLA